MRCIVAGSREFRDYEFVARKLDHLFSHTRPDVIIHGACHDSPDMLGKRWADENGIKVEPYPADWKNYKKAAGFIRNGVMAGAATHLVAFWDGVSPGTKDMIKQAENHGLVIRVVTIPRSTG